LAIDLPIQRRLEEVNQKGLIEPVMQLEYERFTTADCVHETSKTRLNKSVMFGIKRGSWATLTAHAGLGTVQIQGEGHRLMALAKVAEVATSFPGAMRDTIAGWEALTPQSKELSDIPSLVTGNMLTGDVLLTPPGFLTTEKAVNAHNFGVRTPSHFNFLMCLESLKQIDNWFPGRPCCN
jgi:hypothetical protein